MRQQRDENLMLVAAVEQYAKKYGIPTIKSLMLFHQYNVTALIRQHYNALHTQPLEESFYFADDIIKRRQNGN
jgi:isopropylmalate/homocitrate/citramalate synthase